MYTSVLRAVGFLKRTLNIVFFLAFISLFSSCSSELTTYNGVIEANDPGLIYKINGPWDFYWDELAEPDKIISEADAQVLADQSWNKQGFPKFGKATYRLELVASNFEKPAIFIPKINSASKVWVNGKLLCCGI